MGSQDYCAEEEYADWVAYLNSGEFEKEQQAWVRRIASLVKLFPIAGFGHDGIVRQLNRPFLFDDETPTVDEISDADLKEMVKLQQLERLDLCYTTITDAGLNEVAKLRQLTSLTLSDTKITDAGLKELAKLKQLTALALGSTQITDAGLKEVGKLQQLTFLNLQECYKITDAGLKELAKMKQLEHLYLGTRFLSDNSPVQITDGGVAELQKALPNCKIYF